MPRVNAAVAFASLACSIGAAAWARAVEPEPTKRTVTESWHIDYPTRHVQGLAADDESFWISSVDRQAREGWVFRFDRATLKIARKRRLAIDQQYHPGGIHLTDDGLWVPLAEYRPDSTTTVLLLDPKTLATRRAFQVDDHIGAIACDRRGTIYAGNWDCRKILVMDGNGNLQQRRDNPTGVAYQDLKMFHSRLMGVGSLREANGVKGVVDVIDATTWKLVTRIELEGKTRTGGTNFGREGFEFRRGELLVMPEDAPHTTIYSFRSR